MLIRRGVRPVIIAANASPARSTTSSRQPRDAYILPLWPAHASIGPKVAVVVALTRRAAYDIASRMSPPPTRWIFVAALAGCAPPEAPSPAPSPGPDCQALIAAGARARACDPAIDALVDELRTHPDERRCRTAARLLLAPPGPTQGRVVSVYERPPALGETPLDPAERDGLLASPLPGRLVLAPDLAPKPGLPATTATLAGAALRVDANGRLRGHAAPGSHTLEVRHANDRAIACVTLAACETLALTAHGASLAPHPAVRTGPCEP